MTEFPLSDETPLDFEQMMMDLGFTVLPEPENVPEERSIVVRIKMNGVVRCRSNNGHTNEQIQQDIHDQFVQWFYEEFHADDDSDIRVGIDSSHSEWEVKVEDA